LIPDHSDGHLSPLDAKIQKNLAGCSAEQAAVDSEKVLMIGHVNFQFPAGQTTGFSEDQGKRVFALCNPMESGFLAGIGFPFLGG
jgi:hypothetical protein